MTSDDSSIEELRRRCEAAGLLVEDALSEFEDDEGRVLRQHHGWLLKSQAGEFSGAAHLLDDEAVEFALSSQFEDFIPLDGYEAMWSRSTGRIEAELVHQEHGRVFRNDHPLRGTASLLGVACPPHFQELSIPIPTPPGGPAISLGYASRELHVWRTTSPAAHLISDSLLPVVRIDGLQPRDRVDARTQLEDWGHAALLELDGSTDIPLRLRSHYPFRILLHRTRPTSPMSPVTRSPDATPARLYFHARQVGSGNPSAQFLGYYQVIEYYFPRYSTQAEVDRLRRELVGLAGVSDDLLASVVRHTSRSRGIGRELEQFERVLTAVVPGDALRTIVEGDPLLEEFYAQPTMPLVANRIDVSSPRVNLPRAVAQRLYEVRCRIVHTKEGVDSEVFVPFASEAADLHADIRLIEELARRVLLAAGRDLH